MPHFRLLTALLVIAALAGCQKGPPGAGGAKAQPAAASASSPTLRVGPEDLHTVRLSAHAAGAVVTGSLQPERRADLRAEVAAIVLQVLKDNGEPVKRGDLLLRLDDTAIRDSLNSANESARAAGQAHEQAERQVARLKTLQGQGMVSMQALEDAEVRRNAAASELAAARARAATAQQQLRRTEVRAPFDGVVSERKVSAGDTVQIGKELLKVIDPSSMRFEGLVTADAMHELKPGQPVRFRVNGFPDTEFDGRIRRVDAAAQPTTRQVAVLIDFADPQKAPRVAGLYAEGRVQSAAAQLLTVPESALVRAGDATHVWRLGGDTLRKVPVQLGERDGRRGEYPIKAGLNAGDQVLRNPGSALKDGQKAQLVAATAAALPASNTTRN